jgi:hypothetical protein
MILTMEREHDLTNTGATRTSWFRRLPIIARIFDR